MSIVPPFFKLPNKKERFKVGDRVIRITQQDPQGYLEVGEVYTISKIEENNGYNHDDVDGIQVKEIVVDSGYYFSSKYFKLLEKVDNRPYTKISEKKLNKFVIEKWERDYDISKQT